MSKISIIVPAYNASRTLAACLGNLVHQTLSDIEIILVNDCSTDNTLQIMMDCEAQFPEKIIVVDSDVNRGAGGARNVGLCYANGDYIGFVDSDDIVTTDMYEKMYQKAISGDYDIVDCGYFNEGEDNAIIHTSDELAGNLNSYKRNELIASGGYLWSKIFKKSFWDSLNISFRENCILEDCETLMLTFARAKSIGNVKEILYCYKSYETSLTKFVNADSYFKSTTGAIKAVYSTLSALCNYSDIQMAVEYAIVNLCAMTINVWLTYKATAPEHVKVACFKEIYGYLTTMIEIPFEDNKFIMNKIHKDDLKRIREFLKLFS